jgi:NAD(P)-dependent dehydrogenase (short-subunit alcohol dehydrogenase family)
MIGGNLILRECTAEECAKGIMFFVENDFVTGTTVDIDGGWLLRQSNWA